MTILPLALDATTQDYSVLLTKISWYILGENYTRLCFYNQDSTNLIKSYYRIDDYMKVLQSRDLVSFAGLLWKLWTDYYCHVHFYFQTEQLSIEFSCSALLSWTKLITTLDFDYTQTVFDKGLRYLKIRFDGLLEQHMTIYNLLSVRFTPSWPFTSVYTRQRWCNSATDGIKPIPASCKNAALS